jgi:tetratricopeptide (TPR) repeat protein
LTDAERRGFAAALFQRRVPQILGAWVAATWIAIEMSGWLAERLDLAFSLEDALAALMIGMLPAVAYVAWGHGAPGRDRWTRSELVVVVVNLLLALGLALVLQPADPADEGASTTALEVTNELGETETVLVPERGALRQVLVSFLAHEGPADESWWSVGMSELLRHDLEQSVFLLVETPVSQYERGVYPTLTRLGYDGEGAVPLSLLSNVAERNDYDFFVTGSVATGGDAYRVALTVYRTEPVREVAMLVESGADPMALVDALTPALKDAFGLAGDTAVSDDLPVAERMTDSIPAYRAYVEGALARLVDNDFETARAAWSRALELDPSFAEVMAERALASFLAGRIDQVGGEIDQALRYDFKLASDRRYLLRGLKYYLDNQADRRLALWEMWARLEPENYIAAAALGDLYLVGGRTDEAIVQYRRAIANNPGAEWLLVVLAQLYQSVGDLESALAALDRHAELNPENHSTFVARARLHQRLGEIELARDEAEKAALLADDSVRPLLVLAVIDMGAGRPQAVEERLDEAAAKARDPKQRFTIALQRIEWLLYQGRPGAALELLAAADADAAASMTPIERLLNATMTRVSLMAAAGKAEAALADVETLAAQLPSPLDVVTTLLRADLEAQMGRLDTAEASLPGIRETVAQTGLQYLAPMLEGVNCSIDTRREDWPAAAQSCGQALSAFKSSPLMTVELSPSLWAGFYAPAARALLETGREEEARAALDEGLRAFPSHPGLLIEDARWLAAAERVDEAADRLAQAGRTWGEAEPDFVGLAEYQALREAVASAGN